MSFKTLSAILKGEWLIEPQYVRQNIPLIAGLLSGKPVNFGLKEKDNEELLEKPEMALFDSSMETQAYRVGFYTNLDLIPKGSIAVVPLYGPVLKYGDMCSYGLIDKANLLSKIDASGKFKSIVLDVDSPGGQASGTQLLVDTIKNLSIPIIAVVNDGIMASAAMWIGSACDEIYATTTTDMFGSIGVYCTIYDFNAYLEKEGIPVHEIYADKSTDKNKGYRDALKKDYAKIKEGLNFLRDSFVSGVQENRGDRLKVDKIDPFTGDMFKADDALSIGLIDGIISFPEVLSLADSYGDTQNSQSNTNINMFNKFPKLTALKGVAVASITQDQLNAVNTEISESGIAGVTFALDSEIEAGQTAIGKISGLETSITEKGDKVTELENKITELNGTITTLQTKLGVPAEEAKAPKTEKVDATTENQDTKEDYSTSVDAELKKYY